MCERESGDISFSERGGGGLFFFSFFNLQTGKISASEWSLTQRVFKKGCWVWLVYSFLQITVRVE